MLITRIDASAFLSKQSWGRFIAISHIKIILLTHCCKHFGSCCLCTKFPQITLLFWMQKVCDQRRD